MKNPPWETQPENGSTGWADPYDKRRLVEIPRGHKDNKKRANYGTRAKVRSEKLASDESDTRVIVPRGMS